MIRNIVIGMVTAAALTTVSVAQAGPSGAQLQNSLGFLYDLYEYNGALGDGEHVPTGRSDACDTCWELEVGGDSFGGSAAYALNGRELRIGPESMDGLEVSRRAFVPTDGNFVRYLIILHNPTGSPITRDVYIYGNLGSDSNTFLRATSTDDVQDAAAGAGESPADLNLNTDDDWMVTSDSDPDDDGDPVVVHVWRGEGGVRGIDDVDLGGDDEDEFYFGWSDVEVPAGGTVVLVHVGAMALSVDDAVDIAESIHSGAECGLMIQGMSGAEIAATANFDFSDEDEDGLPDCWESAYGFNPANNNAGGDPDGDGLTNLEEFEAGTNPTEADTDGDGLSDGDEVDVYETDPLNTDSDGDGVPDGAEANIGLDPNANQFFASDRVMVTSGNAVRQSEVAVDGTGQAHVVWVEDDGEGEGPEEGGGAYVYYRLFDADGAPLMDAEVASFMPGRAPSVAVDSTGQAFIAWHLGCCNGAWIAKQGAMAPEGASAPQVEEPNAVLLSWYGQHVRIAVDGDDNIHAVWRDVEEESYEIHYAKLDGDGEFLVMPTFIENGDRNMSLNMALDSDGNAHIVWTDDEYSCCDDAVYYVMVDGSDGSLLIDRTRITPLNEVESSAAAGDGEQRHSDIVVDASGLVHIVWSEQDGFFDETANVEGGNAEVYYAQLDPSLRDEEGPMADIEGLLTVAPKLLTADNGLSSYNSTLSIDADGNLMLLWTGDVEEDFFDEDRAQAQGEGAQNVGLCCRQGPLYVQRFDLNGDAVSSVQTLYATDDRNSVVDYPYPRGSAGWATWVEGTSAAFIQNTAAPEPPVSPNGQATVTTSAGAVVFTETVSTTVLPAAAQASLPAGYAFPDGLVRVIISGVTPGGSATVTITFPSAIPSDAVYYKWNTNTGWVQFPFTRTANPNQAVLTLTDGGAGDADGVANGVISDPGGPAVPTAPPAAPVTSSGSGGGGGCAMTTGTRGFDPLLPLLLILALAGGLFRRRSLQGGLS